MSNVIQMPVRCAYDKCRKAIKAPQIATNYNGDKYHTYCYHNMLEEKATQ